ncbi:leucine-rich repeat protein soc-2 homolog [Lineus longissimus]|uniref:leucine-rich repeat protein soc-2 homolog n=1 Tax=Lineus longissimus TaxID=88925 RepID=UPI002B4E3036
MMTSFLMGWAQDWIFFSGNVQTTTIAIAITSSICCSLIWLLVNLASGNDDEKKRGSQGGPSGRGCPMVTFHLRRSLSCVPRQSGLKQLTRTTSHGTNIFQNSEKAFRISCARCGKSTVDKECQLGLCELCCGRTLVICKFHPSKTRNGLDPLSDERPTLLNLSFLDLSSCPTRIGYFGTQLVSLNLSSNKLTSLPDEIGLLLGLEELFLHFNMITYLPGSIGNLTKLKELDLRCNLLEKIPESFGCLQKLKYLNVMENSLTTLPSCIGSLEKLKEINLQNNEIRLLPDELCNLINLQCLYIADNKLTCLPSDLGNLVRLAEIDISDNQLVSLPHQICRCTSLVRLWVTNNRLSSLPAQIGRLHRLSELYLGNNSLQYLPGSIVYLFLNVLILMQNPLIKEEEYIPHSCVYNQSPPSTIPSLLEMAARLLSRSTVQWKEENLPRSLKNYLQEGKQCDSCDRPLFDHFTSKLTFHTMDVVGLRIPLYQMICSPRQCSFVDIPG